MNANRVIPIVVAVLCALVVGLAFASAPAFAEKIYYPEMSFGKPGSEPGQLKEPVGVAVNDSTGLEPGDGDVYVVDEGNNRVERFSTSGVYLGQFDGSGEYEVERGVKISGAKPPTGVFSHPEQVAVDNCAKLGIPCSKAEDPSVGDVYVTDTGHDVIDKFSSTGEYLGQLTETKICEAEKRHEESFPCSKSKAVAVPFKELRNVAVGPSGELWVYEAENGSEGVYGSNYLLKFSDLDVIEAETNITRGRPFGNHALTVDSHGMVYAGSGIANYVVSESLKLEREKLEKEAKGNPAKEKEVAELSRNEESFEKSTAGVLALAAVPSAAGALADDLLVDKGGKVYRYGPSEGLCARGVCEEFPGGSVPKGFAGLSESYGLAVNGLGTVFASERGAGQVQSFEYVPIPAVKTEAPSGVTVTEITLHGSVNPEGEEIKECYFEYGTEPGVYQGRAECEPDAAEINKTSLTATVQVSATVGGLPPAEARTARLVAVSEKGVEVSGGEVSVSRPKIENAAVADVGSSTSTATADIDPSSLETCFAVEYGPTVAYGQSTAKRCVGAGTQAVSVNAELSGLEADGSYHFRFVAGNALGVSDGEDVTFATFPEIAQTLPDGRVYETVSPLNEENSEVYVPGGSVEGFLETNHHGILAGREPFESTPNGETVAYAGEPGATGGNGKVGASGDNEFLGTRKAGGGWTDVGLSPPLDGEVEALAPDMSLEIFGGGGELSGEAPTGYPNLFVHRTAGGSYEPLIRATPPCPTNNTGLLSEGGFGAVRGEGIGGEPLYAGANSGTQAVAPFSHVLFEADGPLPSTPAAPATTANGTAGCGNGNDLYDAVGGRLYLVNVLPNGKGLAGAIVGHPASASEEYIERFTEPHAISPDGSRIYWSAVERVFGERTSEFYERVKGLYLRENDTLPEGGGGECEPGRACTVEVDAPESGAVGPRGGGSYWAASADGSRVFFTDANRLTRDSQATAGEPDLYEYDVEAPEEERLRDLSVPTSPSAHADVAGVVGVSEDGSYVYFVADGVLSEGANAAGERAVEGQPNLYLRREGRTSFIATLAPSDNSVEHTDSGLSPYGDWRPALDYRTADVTPDGRNLTFVSHRSLTGYNNSLDGVSLSEVFVYDADTGRLACASCNPSGESPTSALYPEAFAHLFISYVLGDNAVLPTPGAVPAGTPRRAISGNGSRVFFDSLEPLAPQDTNGYVDVYEWEAPGEGTCTSRTASPVTGGCTFLLSGGQQPENSYLVDTSASGDDAFFVSRADLVKADRSDTEVLYDARVGGVEPPEEVRCAGAGCQGVPPAPPSFATPPSATADGPGNSRAQPLVVSETKRVVARCRRGFVRERVKKKEACVGRKSAKSKTGRAGKAGVERRSHR